jgi:four helix bundle protein
LTQFLNKSDPLWNSEHYRQAMYLYDQAWEDCDLLNKDFRGFEISRQVIRSTGSICVNIEEAYGRGVDTPDG